MKKSKTLKVLEELISKMGNEYAYRADALAQLLGKKLPAMRRYLRMYEALQLLVVLKKGKIKYYATTEAVKKRR